MCYTIYYSGARPYRATQAESVMLNISCLKSPHSFAANTYLLISDGVVSVVDPTVPYNKAYDIYEPGYVFITHCHFDHILEIDSWAEQGFTVIASKRCSDGLRSSDTNCYKLFLGEDKSYTGNVRVVCEGEELVFGDCIVRIMSAPGHTEGSAVYLMDDYAFVGDTVFAGGGFGRWDLPGGNPHELRLSIRKICGLPGHTVLYPGHGERTTVWEYKQQITKRML